MIIPGLPGASLPAGARPSLAAWPYSDLPGGKAAAPTDTTETPPPTARPWPHRELDGHARRPVRRRNRSSHKSVAVLSGSASGGLSQSFRYGLKFDYFGTIEAEKLFGWEGLFVNLHGESRFGQVSTAMWALWSRPISLWSSRKPSGSAIGLDQHADRAVPRARFRRLLRQAERGGRRQHPSVPGGQRHQSFHE